MLSDTLAHPELWRELVLLEMLGGAADLPPLRQVRLVLRLGPLDLPRNIQIRFSDNKWKLNIQGNIKYKIVLLTSTST